MRIIIIIFFIALLIPAPAHAGKTFWDVMTGLFEEEKLEEPDPSQTLQAPFAYNPTRMIEKNKPLPVNTGIPLNLPHRTTREIAEWLMVTVSDVLTFEAGQYKQDLKDEKNYFAASGARQYEEFLMKTSIMQVLQSERYHMHSIVGKTPLLQNEGARDGAYRWLFEIEAMASYIDASNFDYKKQNAVNQKLKLNIQVRRVPENANGLGGKDALVMEIWNGKVETLDKK